MFEIFGRSPDIDPTCWVAPDAVLAGAVTLSAGSSVWFSAVLRADLADITIGAGSNVQDGCVLHADPDLPLTIGAHVSIGHRAVVHGCTVGNNVLVGMSAVVLNGARIGDGSIIAAGSVVLEGTEVPPGSLVAGLPAKVRRPLTEEEQAGITRNAEEYSKLAAAYRAAGH